MPRHRSVCSLRRVGRRKIPKEVKWISQSISGSDGTIVRHHPSVHLGPPSRSGGGPLERRKPWARTCRKDPPQWLSNPQDELEIPYGRFIQDRTILGHRRQGALDLLAAPGLLRLPRLPEFR